jgi:hypothetical protein
MREPYSEADKSLRDDLTRRLRDAVADDYRRSSRGHAIRLGCVAADYQGPRDQQDG